MSSKRSERCHTRRLALAGAIFATASVLAVTAHVAAQGVERPGAGARFRFYPDDPVWRDPDTKDIRLVTEFELSKSYEFVNETFGETVTSRGRALNVNTLDEVPDSS